MQRVSKKLTKTAEYKLMMTQDLNYVQLKLNVEQKVPYIRNCSQKKMFADFVSLGAFVNIFL